MGAFAGGVSAGFIIGLVMITKSVDFFGDQWTQYAVYFSYLMILIGCGSAFYFAKNGRLTKRTVSKTDNQ